MRKKLHFLIKLIIIILLIISVPASLFYGVLQLPKIYENAESLCQWLLSEEDWSQNEHGEPQELNTFQEELK